MSTTNDDLLEVLKDIKEALGGRYNARVDLSNFRGSTYNVGKNKYNIFEEPEKWLKRNKAILKKVEDEKLKQEEREAIFSYFWSHGACCFLYTDDIGIRIASCPWVAVFAIIVWSILPDGVGRS